LDPTGIIKSPSSLLISYSSRTPVESIRLSPSYLLPNKNTDTPHPDRMSDLYLLFSPSSCTIGNDLIINFELNLIFPLSASSFKKPVAIFLPTPNPRPDDV